MNKWEVLIIIMIMCINTVQNFDETSNSNYNRQNMHLKRNKILNRSQKIKSTREESHVAKFNGTLLQNKFYNSSTFPHSKLPDSKRFTNDSEKSNKLRMLQGNKASNLARHFSLKDGKEVSRAGSATNKLHSRRDKNKNTNAIKSTDVNKNKSNVSIFIDYTETRKNRKVKRPHSNLRQKKKKAQNYNKTHLNYVKHYRHSSSNLQNTVNNFTSMTTENSYNVSEMQKSAYEIVKPISYAPQYAKRDFISNDSLNDDDDDSENIKVDYGAQCDSIRNNCCYLVRQIGSTVTLKLKINSSKPVDLFVIHWVVNYHKYNGKNVTVELQPGSLPWNIVWGSRGFDLRISPITNSDIDPNSFIAKVFLRTGGKHRKLFQLIKELSFRIDVLPIDVGKIYAGEEINFNLENFVSLPERGDLTFDWFLEKNSDKSPLQSNMRISNSGRSVLLKELNKEQKGIIACVIYSSTNIAIGKRKFRMRFVSHTVLKREDTRDSVKTTDLIQNVPDLFPQHSQKQSFDSFENIQKKIRKISKRRRKVVDQYGKNTKRKARLRKVIPDIFYATEDPKVIPVKKLQELSMNSDGTLDDYIPREILYIEPIYAYFTDLDAFNISQNTNRNYKFTCNRQEDCAPKGFCLTAEWNLLISHENVGHCYCKHGFTGDGINCENITENISRVQGRRRQVPNVWESLKPSFFKSEEPKTIATLSSDIFNEGFDNDILVSSGVESDTKDYRILTYDEQNSQLLSSCKNNHDCSDHAACVLPSASGHNFCKCKEGYRGNGIFCWETIN